MAKGLAITAILLLAASCGSQGDQASPGGAAGNPSRVEKCVQRFLQQAEDASEEAERYVRVKYCDPFERRGFVHDDGTLSIDAYLTVAEGGTCASAKPGEAARTVPCEDIEQGYGPRVLDCALLHLVPRDEVTKYVERLRQLREVTCDDGTPLADLGA
jgi:hypothetical protein